MNAARRNGRAQLQGAWPNGGLGWSDDTETVVSGGGLKVDSVATLSAPMPRQVQLYAERFSDVLCTTRSVGGDTVACVDSYGRLRLARYPYSRPDAPVTTIIGHRSPARRVCFTPGDGFVMTIGERDRYARQRTSSLTDVVCSLSNPSIHPMKCVVSSGFVTHCSYGTCCQVLVSVGAGAYPC